MNDQMPASAVEIAKELEVLVSSMPQQRGVDGKAAVVAYVAVLNGFTVEEIHRGVMAFLRGEVDEDISLKFCPPPPVLATIIRKTNSYSIAKRQREFQERREQKMIATEPAFVPASPEAKARVQALLKGAGFRSFEDNKLTDSPLARTAEELAERARIRAEFGMTDEVLGHVPNRPKDGNMVPVGNSLPPLPPKPATGNPLEITPALRKVLDRQRADELDPNGEPERRQDNGS